MKRAAILTLVGLSIPAHSLLAQSHRDPVPSLFEPTLELARIQALADPAAVDSNAPQPITFGGWVRPVKWISLGTAAGLAVLGFVLKEQADDRFERLQFLCAQDPDDCRDRNPDGSYRNPELESLFQEVLGRDDQARLSLIAANVSFAASVALFIIDFQRDDGPDDIPYEPPPNRPTENGRGLELSLYPGTLTLKYFID